MCVAALAGTRALLSRLHTSCAAGSFVAAKRGGGGLAGGAVTSGVEFNLASGVGLGVGGLEAGGP
jgi:hypothetical protein